MAGEAGYAAKADGGWRMADGVEPASRFGWSVSFLSLTLVPPPAVAIYTTNPAKCD
jgi:hypothetical protein